MMPRLPIGQTLVEPSESLYKRRSGFLALAILVVGSATAAARAESLPGPTVEFTGDMVFTQATAEPMTIRIYYTADRVRRDLKLFDNHFITIVDRSTNRTYMLFPDKKRYAVRRYDPVRHDGFRRLADGASVERVGPDTINDIAVVKYRLSGKSLRGRPITGFLWLSQQNIMIRMEGETTVDGALRKFTVEIKNLKIGAVDPSAFKIPGDYEKVD